MAETFHDIIPFDFESYAVRSVMQDGKPWFVAVDVCRVLEIKNHRDAVAHLDDDERDGVAFTDAIGRQQITSVVSESGLYGLSARSGKPVAKRFWKWVRSELLPALIRDGSFTLKSAGHTEAPVAVIDQHRLVINRAYLATLSEVHQATAHARAANMRDIAVLVEAGMPRGAAMEAVSAKCGIQKQTLYNHLRLIRMVPEPDWPVALAPQWKKGALARLADKAAFAPSAGCAARRLPHPPKQKKEAA